MSPEIAFQNTNPLPAITHRMIWQSPWGLLWLAGSAKHLIQSGFCKASEQASTVTDLAQTPWLMRTGELAIALNGRPLQMRVWRALADIEYGERISYSALATRCDAPQAVRAVASAVARNPLPVILPCHRVIRQSGAIGEYLGGGARKQAMLALEAATCLEETR